MDMPTLPAIPIQTKPVLWGVAGGALALAIVGFSWGGWLTSGKAEASARIRADDAVVAALAPVCVDRFQRGADAAAQLVELKKADSWSKGSFVEKGGWATVPGTHTPDRMSAVARACADLLVG
jgi:alpha/beta superfamily hydrolase